MIPPIASAILAELAKPDAPVLNLLAMCRTPAYLVVWSEGPELVRRFAQLLLKKGHPNLALEVAARGLDDHAYPNDHQLLYCRALALARSGNPTRAARFVHEMLECDDLPAAIRSDALSLAGRIRKDLALRTSDPTSRVNRFRDALGYYLQAYELTDDTFPGINAATLALLAGDAEQSKAIAARVRDAVLAQIEGAGDDFWLQAEGFRLSTEGFNGHGTASMSAIRVP